MAGRLAPAIGAHPDAMPLGGGGAIARHGPAGDEVAVWIITKGEVVPGDTPLRVYDQERACATLGVQNLLWSTDIGECRVSLHELDVVHLIERTLQETRASIV